MAYSNASETEGVQELGIVAARQGTIYLMGEIATSLISAVLLIFLTRYLQPADFGLYSIAIAFAAILNVAQNFGVGTAYRKMLPEMRKDNKIRISKLLTSGYVVALPIATAIAIAGVLISGVISTSVYHNPALILALELAAVSELLAVIFNLLQAVLVGLGRVIEATIANAVYSALYLVGSVVLVLLGYGVVGAVSGYLIGLIVGAAAGAAYITKAIGIGVAKPDRKDVRSISTFSAPIMASNIAQQGALNLAVLVIGVVAISSVVGNYGAAYKLARLVDITITATTFILVGTFSRAFSRAKLAKRISSIYNNSIYYTAIFLFPIVAFGIASAMPLSRLLFSANYTTTPFFFAVMIGGMAAGIIGTYAGTLMIGSGNTKKFMGYQLGAIAIQIALLLLLAPFFKAVGALIALFVITPIVLDVIYIRALKHQFRVTHSFGPLARVTLASVITGLAMAAVALLMHERILSLLANILVLVVVFPPLLAISRGVSRKNLEFIRSTGRRLRQLHYITDWLAGYTYKFVRADQKAL